MVATYEKRLTIRKAIYAACEYNKRVHVPGRTVCAMVDLHFRQRYSVQAIAARYGLPASTTHEVMKWARQKLESHGLWSARRDMPVQSAFLSESESSPNSRS
jgi:hypothetical protein